MRLNLTNNSMVAVGIATMTEDDILYGVDEAIENALEDNEIQFTDKEERDEFFEDCVSCITEKFERYENDLLMYIPDFQTEVLDLAATYGYLTSQLS